MLIAALASVVACTALSQAPAPSEAALATDLKYGETRVELLDQHGKRQKATLVRVDDLNVALRHEERHGHHSHEGCTADHASR
jgi:hypothetical protein